MMNNNIRLGLCCIFNEHPIRFRIKHALHILKHPRHEQLRILSETILANCDALRKAVQVCHEERIGCFRINSRFLPLKTHPEAGYTLRELPDFERISSLLSRVNKFCLEKDIRLTFHPDAFILLSSPKKEVVEKSVADLLYHDELAEIVGADVINIHGGGGYGNKKTTLKRLEIEIRSLPDSLRSRLTLENDDRIFTPEDLLPFCIDLNIPMVYDIHHHRCLKDGLTAEEATELAIQSWNREPLFHLSSPKDGWNSTNPRPHSDTINIMDFPNFWRPLKLTVEIEAKAKETAIIKLQKRLGLR